MKEKEGGILVRKCKISGKTGRIVRRFYNFALHFLFFCVYFIMYKYNQTL